MKTTRKAFSLADLLQECRVEAGCYTLHGKPLGLRLHIPEALFGRWPYCADAYDFLQYLRDDIAQYGVIEFPRLPLNKLNYTIAMRAPQQHEYSANPFLTDRCQQPHQDTPPYPTAFWLPAERRYFATWLISQQGLQHYQCAQQQCSAASVEDLHRQLLATSLAQGWGLLVNYQPGLTLIDNSDAANLYHARTCRFETQRLTPNFVEDTPMYAFNEVGLLRYIDQMDERRGAEARDVDHVLRVAARMAGDG
ncbi:hypothetical protein EDC56_3431 [Sinobacterium caligoides]|uniref:Uncharacterized protein n=1 Tax=Sinobacterium caligoides TaxID=933926 RepID=A0A3N2DFV6_9GAMM|nr:hypothetical protein [Sinobacterium caligoides]ROR98695.1 hypothetical protein EDC56_3431 [Sinobacterium caligoides]